MAYSQENSRFRTDQTKGFPHKPYSEIKGSALPEPLFDNDECSLWLEHVADNKSSDELLWFMWYDENGKPTIKVSGVFGKSELKNIINKLIDANIQ